MTTTGTATHIKIQNQLSETFTITQGFKRGYGLAPTLLTRLVMLNLNYVKNYIMLITMLFGKFQ